MLGSSALGSSATDGMAMGSVGSASATPESSLLGSGAAADLRPISRVSYAAAALQAALQGL